MKPLVARFLSKARESLASAEADIASRRYNSAANRAYYAAFQSAVALLIEHNLRPRRGSWEHKFVMSRFSGTLVGQRKIMTSRHRGVLERLLEGRVTADYRSESISGADAGRLVAEAAALVREAGTVLEAT